MHGRAESSDKLQAVLGDPVDEKALEQINVVLEDDRTIAGALMADHHLGYSMPIGGVVAYQDAISPSGVGYDIACGNKAVRTDTLVDDLGDLLPWMRMIEQRISFGVGRVRSGSEDDDVDHPLFSDPIWSELDAEPGQPLKQKAYMQLGTVGSGNHYVDLLRDEEGYLWVANHFGSRGLGHAIASMGLLWAHGDGPAQRDEPAVLDLGTERGQLYLAGMTLAGEYAYAGRDYVIDHVLALLGHPNVTLEVHNHHNFAWLEDDLWVVRKGATPLTLDPAFIGGSMGDISVIVRGRRDGRREDGPVDAVEDVGAMGSAPHGAGRVRREAAEDVALSQSQLSVPAGSRLRERCTLRGRQVPRVPAATEPVTDARHERRGGRLGRHAEDSVRAWHRRARLGRRRGTAGLQGSCVRPGAPHEHRGPAHSPSSWRRDGRVGHSRPLQGLTRLPHLAMWGRVRPRGYDFRP